jgi:hypothetical protein
MQPATTATDPESRPLTMLTQKPRFRPGNLYVLTWPAPATTVTSHAKDGGDRGCTKLGSGSRCEDERFLGRCRIIVPWSWTIVRVFEIKGGGLRPHTALFDDAKVLPQLILIPNP